jgi:outer membrane protein OmpA-like peptidoglycan-associated protein
MKFSTSTPIVALALGAGFVALACRAHVETRVSADRDVDGGHDDVDLYPSGEIAWGRPGVDAGPPEPEPPPVVDSDGDGIPDAKDACPSEPEDRDNFEDQDGCPDPDNDRDGIPDVKDRCPNEPETYNGVEDDDGCPESSRGWSCRGGESRITGALIPFDDNSAVIGPSTAAVLDSIVVYVHDCPAARRRFALDGHAEASERNPPALAAARAAAVRHYLVKHGIPSRAIEPASHPRHPSNHFAGDELASVPDRRRVVLHILGAR